MKQPNIAAVFQDCTDALLSYVTSALPIGNHASQTQLGQRFYELWQDELCRGPYVETVAPYARTQSLAALSEKPQDKFEEQFFNRLAPRYTWKDLRSKAGLARAKSAAERLWPGFETDTQERTDLEELWSRNLYSHQLEAFRLLRIENQNAIIATGTGSGKTECFILPLLFRLLTESDSERSLPGVRAILLYPMNALVEDQMARFRGLLFWLNLQSSSLKRLITFGRYTGQTPVNEKDHHYDRSTSPDEIHELGELRYREEMQKAPPDILVTNFTMLEYMLLRNDDRVLFQNSSSLRFLILDEVHTYNGTVGMEVSTLLRRFRDYVNRTKEARYQCVGTSATLGSGLDSVSRMASFAATLFGSPFSPENVLTGKLHRRSVARNQSRLINDQDVDRVLRLQRDAPGICGFFALLGGLPVDEIPKSEWSELSMALKSSIDSQTLVDAAQKQPIEALGLLLRSSDIFATVNNCLETTDKVLSMDAVANKVFEPSVCTARLTDAVKVLGIVLQLGAAARIGDRAALAVRFHGFVKEHKTAYVCLNPKHQLTHETDGWWSNISFVHGNQCKTCSSLLYPLILCRKCGFVVLEGWFREKKSRVFAECDELLGRSHFQRILFRPVSSVQERLKDRLSEDCRVVSLCTVCGFRFPNDKPEYHKAAVSRHSCGADRIIDVFEWRNEIGDYQLLECPYCEQTWIKGQEVYTPPHISLYGAASVLVEELKRSIDAPLTGTGLVNKLLCFSDGRQQAANIASRLQRINEDFTFRQLLFRTLSNNLTATTQQIVANIADQVSEDRGLQYLFCERDEMDDSAIKKRIATLLFKETCSEYRTLESVGLVTVSLPEAFVDALDKSLAKDGLFQRLSSDDRRNFGALLVNWAFRSRRWAVHSRVPLFYDELQQNGYQDRSIMLFGESEANISGFSLKRANPRNRTFNFYRRLSERLASRVFIGGLDTFKGLLERLWAESVCASAFLGKNRPGVPIPDSLPFLVIDGAATETFRLKLNWSSLTWRVTDSNAPLYICDTCGAQSTFSLSDVCLIRECSGKLIETSIDEMSHRRFLPARHYLHLLRNKTPKPVHIEEHTAQISGRERREIETSFKNDEAGNVDVISGSTTFEMGVDLGSLSAVFLANIPPEPPNYRQRAGRAGRRTGMMPIVMTYVRERPHDAYFWSRLEEFIAGPIKVPRFSRPSHEVLLRHANAALFAFLMAKYTQPSSLEGPPAQDFVDFALNPTQIAFLTQNAANPTSLLAASLKAILSANPNVEISCTDCVRRFTERLRHLKETYLALHAKEGVITVLSDYGILPSYNYPIYVDELRLPDQPSTDWPRSALKLQRDRSIALREYFPGRTVVAAKAPIRSIGLWDGYKSQQFQFCGVCSFVNTREQIAECPNHCGPLIAKRAVRPLGGFLGEYDPSLRRVDPDTFNTASTQVLFDPANNPPPAMKPYGAALLVARQSSFHLDKSGARMRSFAPRPDSQPPLELVKVVKRDVALPGNKTFNCLVVPCTGMGQSEFVYLMHEFTTDIVRLQLKNTNVGKLMLSASALVEALRVPDHAEQQKYINMHFATLAQALCSGGARYLNIDPRELVFTSRQTQDDVVFGKEIIIFDAAPGGAGYCDQLVDDLPGWFNAAMDVLTCPSDCGDSCYSCLRSYDNQPLHPRLNRFLVREGLEAFNKANWALGAAT